MGADPRLTQLTRLKAQLPRTHRLWQLRRIGAFGNWRAVTARLKIVALTGTFSLLWNL